MKDSSEGIKQTKCLNCFGSDLKVVLDFGRIPASNLFYPDPMGCEPELFPLVLCQCNYCGLIQLSSTTHLRFVEIGDNGINYNEPEAHLNSLVSSITNTYEFELGDRIIGLTYKDKTLLNRFESKGYVHTKCFDSKKDLGFAETTNELVKIQSVLNYELGGELAKSQDNQGKIIVMRHLLEHAANPSSLLGFVEPLLEEGGFLVIEVPDVTKAIQQRNYPTFWEEHVTYFTAGTLRDFLTRRGFEVLDEHIYPFAYEDSLVMVVKKRQAGLSNHELDQEVNSSYLSTSVFSESFESHRKFWLDFCSLHKAKKNKIAVFGAGHVAIKFINFFDLSSLVDCFLDDHPSKVGRSLPLSELRIVHSGAIFDFDICLHALSPSSELLVRSKFSRYLQGHGELISILENPECLEVL